MCEKELLVSYLYDDMPDADRVRFESHLRGCVECRDELSALRDVRADLVEWAPSQPDLGFRIVLGRQADTVAPPVADIRWPPPRASWRAWWTPAAGLAAAAVLVLALASAIARVEVHRGPDGITVRTGWGASNPAPAAVAAARPAAAGAVAPTPASTSPAVDPALVAAIDRRLRALETSRDANVRAASISARSDAEMIRRVRDLMAQSETKQQGELALRISQVMRDVDAQRVADLNRIQQRFGRLDASVTAEAAAHGEVMNYLLASAKQK